MPAAMLRFQESSRSIQGILAGVTEESALIDSASSPTRFWPMRMTASSMSTMGRPGGL